MSTSLGGLRLFMKTVIDSQPWMMEDSCIAREWKISHDDLFLHGTQKLKVAVMWDDHVVTPHPPVTRALHEVVKKLETLEWIEVVPWEPYKHDEACISPTLAQDYPPN